MVDKVNKTSTAQKYVTGTDPAGVAAHKMNTGWMKYWNTAGNAGKVATRLESETLFERERLAWLSQVADKKVLSTSTARYSDAVKRIMAIWCTYVV